MRSASPPSTSSALKCQNPSESTCFPNKWKRQWRGLATASESCSTPSKYIDENKQRCGCFFSLCASVSKILSDIARRRRGKHNGRGNDGGSEATFLSAPCPSFAHPPPQPFSLPTSPISSDNNTGKGVEEEEEEVGEEEGCWTLLVTHTSRVCLRVLPSRHFCGGFHSVPMCGCEPRRWGSLASPRTPRSIPLLITLVFLSPFHCVTPRHFTRSEGGEVDVREVRASSCTRVAQSKGSRMRQSSAVGALTHTDPNLFRSSGVVNANRKPTGCRKKQIFSRKT